MSTENQKAQAIQTQSAYRSAFKATGLFGGVQLVNILISIVRSKFVAIWLGTSGYGLMSLFNTVISLTSALSNLGLQSSAVRDIASEHAKEDAVGLAKVVKAINRWVFATGIAGALLMICLSPLLSQILFESNKHVLSFVVLSCVVLMMGIYNGQYAILQGMRQLSLVAKANVFGSLAGFCVSMPLFYFLRADGIVLALVLSAVFTALISAMYAKKIRLLRVDQSVKESFILGLGTVKLGIAMSVAMIFVYVVEFVVKTYISHIGGIGDVGLYQAGWALNVQYLGLVFTAMAKDYFPRLSQRADDNDYLKERVNEQAELAVLLLGPMILFMLIFLPYLIELFYTREFLSIVAMTQWLLIGSIIKAGSWAISFVFLAKGNSKQFLINELGIQSIILPSYLIGYTYFGLEGIGYAFTFNFVAYFLWVAVVAYKRYGIHYHREFWTILLIETLLPVGYVLSLGYIGDTLLMKLGVGVVMLLILGLYSLRELDKRLDLRAILRRMLK